MQVSEEQIRKAIAAKSAEELLEMAKAENLSLTEEEAEHYFEVLHADHADAECVELSEEEQKNVAGGSQCVGGKSYSSDSQYYLITTWGNSCPAYEYNGGSGVARTCFTCRHVRIVTGASGPIGAIIDSMVPVTYCLARTVDNDPYR